MSIQVQIIEGPLAPIPAFGPVEGAGALLSFEGVVRPLENGSPIAGLHYQVYEPMASNLLEQLARETLARFGLLGVFVQHSRGDVPCGQCSFRLRVASAHRKEALAAMDYFIDRLKADVPIWKRPSAAALGEELF